MKNSQRGGTLAGFIFGVVVGLAAALVVAIYVTKMPNVFVSKGSVRNADSELSEDEKNKGWNPNAPLQGKSLPPMAEASAAASPQPPFPTGFEDPSHALIKVEPAEPNAPANPPPGGPNMAEPLAIEVKPQESKVVEVQTDNNPFIYFIQTGAYRTAEEAEAQRQKTIILGIDTKISEREQGGRSVFRVRIGPMEKTPAEHLHMRLMAYQIEGTIVRVQR